MQREDATPSPASTDTAAPHTTTTATTTAPLPSITNGEPIASLSASFHRRQAAALQHFMNPSSAIPDEAAVGRSPDLSSTSDQDDMTCASGSPFSSALRPTSCVSQPLSPIPLLCPVVRIGGASPEAATATRLPFNSDVLRFEGMLSQPAVGRHRQAHLESMGMQAGEKPAATASFALNLAAAPVEEEEKDGDTEDCVDSTRRSLRSRSGASSTSCSPAAHHHRSNVDGTREVVDRVAVYGTLTQSSTPALSAAPSLPGWSPTITTSTAAAAPAPARGPSTVARVVWRADVPPAVEVGAGWNHSLSPVAPRIGPNLFGVGHFGNGNDRAVSPIDFTSPLLRRPPLPSALSPPRVTGSSAATALSHRGGGARSSGDTPSSSSESDSEGDDAFEDGGGGGGSELLFYACVVCIGWCSCLLWWCISWPQRCYRLACSCCRCGSCKWCGSGSFANAAESRRASSFAVAREETREAAQGSDSDIEDEDREDAQLRRPLLPSGKSQRHSRAGGHRRAAAPPLSSPPQQQQPRPQTSRAVQSLHFSDNDEDDEGSGSEGDGAPAGRGVTRNTLRPFHPTNPTQSSATTAVVERRRITSLLRRFVKRFSRRSLRATVAYFNVFSHPIEVAQNVGDAAGAASAQTSVAYSTTVQMGSGNGGGVSATPNVAAAGAALTSMPPVSAAGQIFILFHFLALALLTMTVLMLALFEFRQNHVAAVQDATACNRFPYRDRFRPDFSFSLICFMLNGVLATRYAVRAVRYEQGGLLVVQVVIVALQVCRAFYFLLFVSGRYLRRCDPSLAPPDDGVAASPADNTAPPLLLPLAVLAWVGLLSSAVLFLFASAAVSWVYAGFGWRRYAQGIVRATLTHVRQRMTALQTCVQLDTVITLNAYLASVFLVDTWEDQAWLLAMTGLVLVVYALLVPALRHTRRWWLLLCAGCVLLTVSAYSAALIGSSLQSDYHLRSMSSSPWYSACYAEELPDCLGGVSPAYPVSIYRDGLAAARVAPASAQLNYESLRVANAILSERKQEEPARQPPSSCLGPRLRSVDNLTDTFLPTFSAFPDYFRIGGCSETCFMAAEAAEQHRFVRGIAHCCDNYGQCRLKDAYRTYAVLLLALLTVLSYVVRVVLLAVAWRRCIERDDAVIEAFVRETRRQRHHHHHHHHRRRASWQLPQAVSGVEEEREGERRRRTVSLAPPAGPRSRTSQPLQGVLVWNISQYNMLRYGAESDALQPLVVHYATPQRRVPSGAEANPLSF